MKEGEPIAWKKFGVPDPIIGEFVNSAGTRDYIRYLNPVTGEWRYTFASRARIWSIADTTTANPQGEPK